MAPRLRRDETVLPPRRSLRIKEMKMKSAAKTQTQILPHELILEILCWLLPKPLVRFKCVSKLWRESIEDHSFTHKHSRNLGRRQQRLLISIGKITNPKNDEYFEILCGANGLVLERSKLENKYRVRNPITRHVLDLPDPIDDQDNLFPIIVYAYAEKKYKLFCLYKKELEGTIICGGFKILTLETDDTWRNVDIPEFCVGLNEKYSLQKGSLLLVLTGDYQKIVSTEMESERISIVDNIPKDFITAAGTVSVNSWNNKFSISRMDRNGAGEWKVDVWVLEDDKEHKWAESKISVNLSFINRNNPISVTEMRLLNLNDKTLWLSVNSDKHIVGYNIVDKNARLVVRNTDACKRVKDGYCPSMAYLKGMKPEDRDISDYEIFQTEQFF